MNDTFEALKTARIAAEIKMQSTGFAAEEADAVWAPVNRLLDAADHATQARLLVRPWPAA